MVLQSVSGVKNESDDDEESGDALEDDGEPMYKS